MPIDFDLEKIRKQFDCTNYFETGLWDPRDEKISTRKALTCKFKNIFCVELRKEWVDLGREIFKKEIEEGRYTLINDDSNYIAKYLTGNIFEKKTLFFLDAHVDNENIRGYINKCPLINELNAIKQMVRKDNIIMVDDLRILRNNNPWGETSYGKINFIDKIKEIILEINPGYKFKTLDGYVKNDVLMAYV